MDYVRLEIHYNNPNLVSGIKDSSGLRLWMTKSLRQYDADMIQIGHLVNTAQIVPPFAKEFKTIAHCSSECVKAVIILFNKLQSY